MKITIVGATGGVGRHVLEQATADKHDVTAVVRNPHHLPEGTRSVRADLCAADPDEMSSAILGADAVLSALGPRSKADVGVMTRGAEVLMQAMATAGVSRLVVISAAPVATVPSPGRPNPPRRAPGDGWVVGNVLQPVVKRVFRSTYADMAEMEYLVESSRLDWTVLRPPRLTNKKLTGTYRTAYDANVRHGMSIGRADLAHLMLAVLSQPQAVGRTIGVAY